MSVRIICAGVATLDIVLAVDTFTTFGGKQRAREANVVGGGCAATAAVAIARLGGRPSLASRLGDDTFGRLIIDELTGEGVDCDLVRRFPSVRSSFSAVLVDAHGERHIVNYRDEELEADAAWIAAALPEFDVALGDTRWVEATTALFEVARARGKPCVLDAEGPFHHSARALQLATHAAFSAAGLCELTGLKVPSAALAGVASECGGIVSVTDGADGAYWLEGEQVLHAPGFAVQAVDTLGAGDVWHGAFALALGEQQKLDEALRFANAAAALKCETPGGRAGAPRREAVEQLLAAN
ncbi:MAG: PfkB family carbohydrate kinase [Pseudomonadota bacterium]